MSGKTKAIHSEKVAVHGAEGEGEAPAEPVGKGEIPDGERLGRSLALPAALKNAARYEAVNGYDL